jgi:nicotinamide mononucleotide (NMN) deamidase PncC
VDQATIERHGSVSSEVTIAMAEGTLEHSDAQIAVAVTGVAGPEPDEKGNSVALNGARAAHLYPMTGAF